MNAALMQDAVAPSNSTPTYPQPNRKEMARTLDVLFEPDDVIELRCLKAASAPKTQCFSGDMREKLIESAVLANVAGWQCYVQLNERDPSAGLAGATSDALIVRRRWILIDVDPERPAGTSAAYGEAAAANQLAFAVFEWLRGQGWPAPVIADSGNGTHLLYAINQPNDAATLGLVKRVLEALHEKFSGPACKVDTSVSNASRITKLYGSVAKKGEHREDRHHRVSGILRSFARVEVTVEQLMAVAALAPNAAQLAESQAGASSQGVADGSATTASRDAQRSSGARTANDAHRASDIPHGTKLERVVADLASALEFLSADSYESWFRYGLALKTLGAPGREVWLRWSASSAKHDDGVACAKWDSLRPDRTDYKVVFADAQAAGWANPGNVARLHDGADPSEIDTAAIITSSALRKAAGRPVAAMEGTEALLAAATMAEAASDPAQDDRQHDGTRFSPRLLNPGGIVGEIVRWILSTSPKPQPALAVTAALVMVGSSLANRVRCGRSYSHLYCVNVANSGEGKDRPQECVAEAFEAAGAQTRAKLPGEELASGQSLMAVASREPTTVLVLDEFGDMLGKATAKSAASFEREVLTILKKFWSHAGRTMRGKEYADQKIRPRQDVQYPCLSLLGSSTPGRFYASITPNEIEDGCLNRMLIVRAANFSGVATERVPQPVPTGITRWLAAASVLKPAPMGAPDDPHQPRNVVCSGMAEGILRQFAELAERERTLLQADSARAALAGWWVRAAENARRIALILSMGRHTNPAQLHAKADADQLEIDCESAQWAVDYVHAIVVDMLAQSESRIGDGEFERAVLGVEAALRRAGAKGLTRREACRNCNAFERIFDPAVADRVWASVRMRGSVELETPPKSGRGPARRFLVCRELAEAARAV